MSWGAVAAGVVGAVGSYAASSRASRSSRDAAGQTAESQREGLDYLIESERLPMYYRDQALGMLAGEYGLPQYTDEQSRPVMGYEQVQVRNPEYDAYMESAPRGPGIGNRPGSGAPIPPDMPEYIYEDRPIYGNIEASSSAGGGIADIARRSPLYEAILSGRQQGEESLARNMGATGRLRGGQGVEALADYNTNLENQALLASYQNVMGGLSSLAGAQGYAPQIAQQYSNIGQTVGAGELGAARAEQQGFSGIAQGLGAAASAYANRPKETI